MCGLAGIICLDQRFGVEARTLRGMLAAIEHRGPDASGTWQTMSEKPYLAAGLVHCRLSILDLDARANQPMLNAAGRLAIIFNGEIYNFRELRQEIQQRLPHHQFRTTGDTEVILAAYQAWGDKCVQKFNGMFAFVIIDTVTGTIFAARDRMGQKPLYFSAVDSAGNPLDLIASSDLHRPIAAIAFGSEIGAVLEAPWQRSPSTRPDVLTQYLLWGYIPSPATMYEGVWSLPPAHAMTISLGQARCWRYFDPNERRPMYNPGETDVQATRRLVMQAVRRQMVSDVPIGCFLSGGIDSSIIAAAMKQACLPGQEVHTFSIAFDDARFDESPHARAIAKHLGTRHEEFRVQMHAADDLPKILASFGQPFADSSAIPTYYLSQVTRQAVKVALSGDGGDELFGGYDRYRAMSLAERMPPLLRGMLSLPLWQRLPGTHPKSRLTRMKRFLHTLALPPADRYAGYMQLFSPGDIASLLPHERAPEAYLVEAFERLMDGRDSVQAALALDRLTYLPEDLLVKVDRCSMRFALEVRSPFMDHDLMSFAAGLESDQLLARGSKTLLRKAFAQDVPRGHFNRPKMGFAVPIGEWFRGELRPMVQDMLLAKASFASTHFDHAAVQRLIDEHVRNVRDHSQRLYALLALEMFGGNR